LQLSISNQTHQKLSYIRDRYITRLQHDTKKCLLSSLLSNTKKKIWVLYWHSNILRVLSICICTSYGIYFIFCNSVKFCENLNKVSYTKPNFQSMLKIQISTLDPHTWLFLCQTLNYHLLCGTVATETVILLPDFNKFRQPTITLNILPVIRNWLWWD